MKSLNEISAKAKEYAPDREDLQDAFVNGARYAITGKYYIQADVFTSIPSVPSFDDWWNAYDKKCGRKKAEARWNRIPSFEKIACMKATPAYVRATPDKAYRKHPLTYLNGECWNDEIIIKRSDEQQRLQSLAEKTASILNAD